MYQFGGCIGPILGGKRYHPQLVPLLLTGVSLHPLAPKGGPTRTSADVSVPRLAGFSLITLSLLSGRNDSLPSLSPLPSLAQATFGSCALRAWPRSRWPRSGYGGVANRRRRWATCRRHSRLPSSHSRSRPVASRHPGHRRSQTCRKHLPRSRHRKKPRAPISGRERKSLPHLPKARDQANRPRRLLVAHLRR